MRRWRRDRRCTSFGVHPTFLEGKDKTSSAPALPRCVPGTSVISCQHCCGTERRLCRRGTLPQRFTSSGFTTTISPSLFRCRCLDKGSLVTGSIKVTRVQLRTSINWDLEDRLRSISTSSSSALVSHRKLLSASHSQAPPSPPPVGSVRRGGIGRTGRG